jgi:hypothetical protein
MYGTNVLGHSWPVWVSIEIPWEGKRRNTLHWYNPKTMCVEDVPAPISDEEALLMLRGDINSAAFLEEYERLREEGMGVEQAMLFVGHKFRLVHLRYQPIG